MPSAIPRVDESVRWPRHQCNARHRPDAPCPPASVWLIARTPIDKPWRLNILPNGARAGS